MSDTENPAETTVKKVKLYPVRLKADYWPEADIREKSGTTINVPLDEAKALVKAGTADRADELGA